MRKGRIVTTALIILRKGRIVTIALHIHTGSPFTYTRLSCIAPDLHGMHLKPQQTAECNTLVATHAMYGTNRLWNAAAHTRLNWVTFLRHQLQATAPSLGTNYKHSCTSTTATTSTSYKHSCKPCDFCTELVTPAGIKSGFPYAAAT